MGAKKRGRKIRMKRRIFWVERELLGMTNKRWDKRRGKQIKECSMASLFEQLLE